MNNFWMYNVGVVPPEFRPVSKNDNQQRIIDVLKKLPGPTKFPEDESEINNPKNDKNNTNNCDY